MRALSFAFGLLMAVIATTGHAQQGPTSSPVKPKEICHVGGCCQDDPGTQEICYFQSGRYLQRLPMRIKPHMWR